MIYDDAPPPSFARPPIGVIPKWLWIEKMNDELDAATAYNEKAVELYGEFANLNQV